MEENESLFLALQQDAKMYEPGLKNDLIHHGYLDQDGNKTDRAKEFVERFIDEKLEIVYQAVMNSIDDFEAFFKLRDQGVFTTHPAFLAVVRHLANQGRILKKN